jgi:hypothetical protein
VVLRGGDDDGPEEQLAVRPDGVDGLVNVQDGEGGEKYGDEAVACILVNTHKGTNGAGSAYIYIRADKWALHLTTGKDRLRLID